MSDIFRKFSEAVSRTAGEPLTFVAAIVVILVWIATGPIFRFSDTWQLIINTGTTIVTFLMVFLLQNTTNRESRATQIKLDELIRAVSAARTSFIDLEEVSDHELDRLEGEFRNMAERAGATREKRQGQRRGPAVEGARHERNGGKRK